MSDFKELLSHPFFARNVEDMQSSDAFAALQALKYESEIPDDNAKSYIEEGDYHFERKEYDMAITAYTAGISAKPTDTNLLSVLFTNRSISNSLLRNFGSCIKDYEQAISISPLRLEGYIQAAMASNSLSKVDKCIKICDEGLKIFPNNQTLSELKQNNLHINKVKLSKQFKEKTENQIQKYKKKCITLFIKKRGIPIISNPSIVTVDNSLNSETYIDSESCIHWSIMLMYPEFGKMDNLQDVPEFTKIKSCLSTVFDCAPSWDEQMTYTNSPNALQVYYQSSECEERVLLTKPSLTIKQLTTSKNFCVHDDLIIKLYVVSKLSTEFYNNWIKRNES